jgi:hypothetical protein
MLVSVLMSCHQLQLVEKIGKRLGGFSRKLSAKAKLFLTLLSSS